ncbi:MAG: PrgI family protein [Candidatus Nealsonbacteria bacterium]|nr:PrgI family protein [Candidatus Nealsonbacteria bacterium]
MNFTVPQFIEHEAKIVGPLTFKQFIFIGMAVGICFVFYFTLPFNYFLMLSMLLLGVAMGLAFYKINGKALPVVLFDFLKFSMGPKMYVWKKREQQVKVYKKSEVKPPEIIEEKKEETTVRLVTKSRLKKTQTDIETHTK